MVTFGLFVSALFPIAKIVPFKDACFLKKSHGAVDSGNADMPIDLDGTAINLIDIRVVGCI
ncbi:hypothetical protein amb0917 [Paramagnetospirillum magneticum AMB-1]|uniref:Uncharacterized protein n=1 Tax=Paramagnetospirillum magneticum (strain ATCC 700264 / AMB-1) TaxID=342108 RepID=Q2W8V4_PARM1|nr:hypothetical protein amb0917 [Paramagnetospirillum magneticum AMB-1]